MRNALGGDGEIGLQFIPANVMDVENDYRI